MDEHQLDIDALFQCLEPYNSAALAVSGGADSVALMLLLKDWLSKRTEKGEPSTTIHILTVDHGLRPESQHEVLWVKKQAEELNFPVAILRWQGEKAKSSIQEKARDARYQLMSEWCHSNNIPAIITAHHLDDQAETVIMRLARGSGIDGLAAISNIRYLHNIILLRPLLDVSKKELILYLKSINVDWLDDPSNDNTDFERVRIRNAFPTLQEIGLESSAIARSAKRIRRASNALDYYAQQSLVQLCRLEPEGYAVIDRNAVFGLPEEVSLRCLTKLVHLIGGKAKIPSMQKMENLYEQLKSNQAEDTSVAGCVIRQIRNTLLIAREVRSRMQVTEQIAPGSEVLWDNRFRIGLSSGAPDSICIRFLTKQGYLTLPEKFKEAPARDDFHFSPSVRASLPSFWIHDRLIAVPHLNYFAEDIPKNIISVEFVPTLN